MYKEKKIIVIAPCHNEAAKVSHVIERIKEMKSHIVDEIVVVDDASTDGSVNIARRSGATVIELHVRSGVGATLRNGIDYATERGFDICVCIAGNNKDEPNEIPRLLEPIVDGVCDLVQGSRYVKGGEVRNTPAYRRLATKLHPILFSLFVGKSVTESTNGFRAFRIDLLHDKRINLHQSWLNKYELEPYLLFKTIKLGYKHTEVPCTKTYPSKDVGQTKMMPIIGWWSILRPILYLGLGIKK
jgi:dolichol-phosphate mannosyltransferase